MRGGDRRRAGPVLGLLRSSEHCCPREGKVTDERSGTDVRLAFVSTGRAPRRDRADLVASLAPAAGSDPAALVLNTAVACATRAFVEQVAGTGPTLPAALCTWRRRTAERLDAALRTAAVDASAGRLDVDTQALLVVALVDVQVRDLLVAEALRGGRLAELGDVLARLVRRLASDALAPVAATLAMVCTCVVTGRWRGSPWTARWVMTRTTRSRRWCPAAWLAGCLPTRSASSSARCLPSPAGPANPCRFPRASRNPDRVPRLLRRRVVGELAEPGDPRRHVVRRGDDQYGRALGSPTRAPRAQVAPSSRARTRSAAASTRVAMAVAPAAVAASSSAGDRAAERMSRWR